MAQKRPWPYDPRLRELLDRFLKMARIVRKPYAIGGALAMAAHGYQRQTTDVDAFLLEKDRWAWIRAAQKTGLTVDPVFRGHHYIAFLPEHGDPRVRIDLMFPAEASEVQAIRSPAAGEIGGVRAKVIKLEMMAVMKFLSDRPEDRHDFLAMLERGLFEPDTVRILIAHAEPGSLREFDRVVRAARR